MIEEKPNYYAVIPASVRYDKRLKPLARLLYGEIAALCNKNGYCYATNKYFAELYDVSIVTISNLIKNLVDCGHIESVINYKEGTKEIFNRYLKILYDPIKENFKENNTSINNIYCPSGDERDNQISLSGNEEPSETNTEQEELSDQDKFEELWKLYPRKDGKHTAFLHYCSWLRGKNYCGKRVKLTPRQMWYAICKYREHLKANNTEKQFIQMGSTFFNTTIYEYLPTSEEIEAHSQWM